MDPETVDQIVNFLIVIAIPSLAAYFRPLIKEYVKVRIEAIRHDQLRTWVWDFVQATEQMTNEWITNEDKRIHVTKQLIAVAESFGLKLTGEQALALLESAVYSLKQQRAKPAPVDNGAALSDSTSADAPLAVVNVSTS